MRLVPGIYQNSDAFGTVAPLMLARTTLFDLKVGATVSLNRDVPVQVGSRMVTLGANHRMTFLGREGSDAVRIRYAGAN